MNYKEIIELDDTELEQKGVAALGARRKMLKEFEKVKKAMVTTYISVISIYKFVIKIIKIYSPLNI